MVVNSPRPLPPWLSRSASPASGAETSHFTTSSSPTPGTPPSDPALPIRPQTNETCRTARNSRPLEVIGTYDPIPKPDPYDHSGKLHKDIKLDTQRARYWIGVGAQPTDTAWRLLSMVGILPKKQFGPKQDQQKGTVKTEEVKVR